MILTEKIKIKINSSNFNYYKKFYDDITTNEIIEIKINELYTNSKSKIEVKCDVCEKIKNIAYDMYKKNIKNGGYYSCSKKCSLQKYRNTCLLKYGVNNPSKSEEIKDKIKKTNLKKYGTEYTFQSNKIKDKIKKTNLKRYKVEYPQQNKKILEKSNVSNMNKYGYERASESIEVKNKISKKLKKHYMKNLIKYIMVYYIKIIIY